MQRLKILGLALTAVFVLSAIASTAASAEELPNFLPLGTEASPVTFINKSGKGTLETLSLEKVTCEKSNSTGEITSPKLGRIHITFEGCKSGGVTCTGLADPKETAGNILVLGQIHIKRLLTEPKHVYLVVLLEHVHFTCFIVLVLVLGCVAGLILKPNILTKVVLIHWNQNLGVQEPTEVSNDAGTADEKCILETKKGEGKYEQSGQLVLAEAEKFEQGGKAVEALIMS